MSAQSLRQRFVSRAGHGAPPGPRERSSRTASPGAPSALVRGTVLLLVAVVGLSAPATGQENAAPGPYRSVGSGVPADAAEILEAIDPYTGHWRSDRKSGPEGEDFHFEYDLGWLDEGRTIAAMLITRVDADGSVGTVFEGYKGREPDGGGVYYFAVSPSGRGARGRVVLDGEQLVTRYRGWTAEGDAVEIRDVFEPVREGVFRSTTFLRASPDEEWRQIAADTWTRVGPANG